MECSSLPPPAVARPPVDAPALLVCGVNSKKLTFAEWWRSSPGLNAIVGWIGARLGAGLLESARILVVRDSAALEIPMDALSEDVSAKIKPQIASLSDLGFGVPRAMLLNDVFANRQSVLAMQVHCSGKTVARTLYTYPLPGATAKTRKLFVGFLTQFADGRMLYTGAKRPAFLTAPTVAARWQSGSVRQRYAAHEKNIEQFKASPVIVKTPEDAFRACDNYEKTCVGFGVERGLYFPVDDAECAKVVAATTPEEARDAATFAELVRLQGAKGGSISKIVLLLVSLALFAGTGRGHWSWKTCALIAAILFVHELGHFAAMRWFKYREVRMFFVPFFGAAVTGKHYNVPGWKKAIVSLMGPLPGIGIGAGLAVFGAVTGNIAVLKAAEMTIGLNVFNLLPIVPLDGGWFWNSILFCRHRWLEAGFKLVAAFALIAGAFVAGRIFIYLGIAMLIAVPKTLRLGRVAARLRQRGWQNGESDTISAEAAENILGELKRAAKTPPPAKMAAAETLSIFENLNAHPPNWLESFGLSAAYGVAIVVALFGFGLAGSAKNQEMASRIAVSMRASQREHVPVLTAAFHGEIAQSQEAGSATDDAASRRIIATYRDATCATAAFAGASSTVKTGRLVRFGQTLIAVANKKDTKTAKAMVEEFRSNGGQVFDTGAPLGLTQADIRVAAPSLAVAQRLERELKTYFALPMDLRGAAPWDATDRGEDDRAKQLARADATYVRILKIRKDLDKDPELLRVSRANAGLRALFRSREASVSSWQEIRATRSRLLHERLLKLHASDDPEIDHRVTELVLREPRNFKSAADMEAAEVWRGKLRLLITGEETAAESAQAWVMAKITSSGNQITLSEMYLTCPERTLPALAEYLSRAGCTDLRYGFYKAEDALDRPSLLATLGN